METAKYSLKIAILLDADSCISNAVSCSYHHLNTLQLVKTASLKLLLDCKKYVNASSQFQWTHYTFSQNSESGLRNWINKRAKFRELSLDSFQDFEQSVDSISLKEVLACHEDEYINAPAKQIRNALQNVIADLQWTPPDITSPVKRPGRRESIRMQVNSSFDNHIVLFTFSSHIFLELKTIASNNCTETNKDEDRFQSIFEDMIPKTLQRTITDVCKIKIHIVDLTSCLHKSSLQEFLGEHGCARDFLEKGLRSVNGRVFPINRLLSYNVLSSHIKPLVAEDSKNETDKERTGGIPILNCTPYVRENILQLPCYVSCLEEKTVSVVFHSVNGDISLNVKLKAVDIAVPADGDTCSSFTDSHSSIRKAHAAASEYCHSVRMESGSAVACDFKCLFQHQHQQNESDSNKDEKAHLQVLGTVMQHEVPSLIQHSPQVYFVLPDTTENLNHFEKIMLHSAEMRIAQVMELRLSSFETCVGILQPLTRLSAVLSVLGPGVCDLALGKLLLKATAAREVEEKTALDDFVNRSICGRCLDGTHAKDYNTEIQTCPTDGVGTFSACLLEKYYLPGTESQTANTVMAHMNTAECEDKAVHDFELKLLRKLQKKYMAKKSVRLNAKSKRATRTPVKTPRKAAKMSRSGSGSAHLRRSPRKKCPALPSNEKIVLPPRVPVRKSRSHTAPTRTDQLWQSYRQSVVINKDRERETHDGTAKDDLKKEKEGANKVGNLSDMENEEDLMKFLTEFYDDVIQNCGMNETSAAQTLVNTSVHFFKSKQFQDPEKQACDVLAQLLKENSSIKQKYEKNADQQMLFREYEIQVVLYTETETIVTYERTDEEIEDKVTKVAGILRAMSFMRDPEFLGSYMKNVLLQNYVETAPVFLSKIYDELLLPLPPVLESLMSPDELSSSATKSVNPLMSVASNTSSHANSIMVPSNRPQRDRKLNRYRSFHAVSNRQIAVPKLVSGKEKKRTPGKKRRVSTRIASMTKRSATKKNNVGKVSESKRVCKNLFGDEGGNKKPVKLERRQSCMAAIHTKKQRTPKGHHVLKSRRVAETPAHKQKNKIVWRRHEKERRKTLTAEDVEVIAESPDKRVHSGKQTPIKASQRLMKQRSFYSENVTRTEKLEARMMSQKILSPTWNKPKFGSLLQKTPPRRIQPRMLFSALASPSPQKLPEGNIPQPVVDNNARFNLGKAVAALNFMQSPSKNTRSQQANIKAFSTLSGDPFQRCFTPHGRTLLMSPVRATSTIQIPKTPTSVDRRSLIHTPIREGSSVSRRVSFSTTLLTPQKELHRPCPAFQSPIKSILTPTKYNMPPRAAVETLKSPTPQTDSVRYLLRNTPQKSSGTLDSCTAKSPCMPLRTLSSGLDSSPSDNSANQSPRVTRSASKSGHTKDSNAFPTYTRARANLTSLLEGKSSPAASFARLGEVVETVRSQTLKRRMEDKENDSIVNEEETSPSLKRRMLRARMRSGRSSLFQSPQKQSTGSSVRQDIQSASSMFELPEKAQTRGVKRKETDDLTDRTSHKRSCSRISSTTVHSLGSFIDTSVSDYSEVFLDDSALNKTRNSEGPVTRSSLMSDNSNSALSFSELPQFSKQKSSESELGNKDQIPPQAYPDNPKIRTLVDFAESENSRSPEFCGYVPKRNLSLRILSSRLASDTDTSVSSSPVLQVERTKTPVPEESDSVVAMTTPARNTRACSMSSDKQLETFSPSVKQSLQSPSGGNKYSPLSTKSLVQLIESPILDGTAKERKAKAKALQKMSPEGVVKGVSSENRKSNEFSPTVKRPARRSLYGSQTKTKISN